MDDMTNNYKNLLEQYQFLSHCEFGEDDIIGIIVNSDKAITSICRFDILSDIEKSALVELGNEWWNNSNRTIPINIYFGDIFSYFSDKITHYNSRNIKVVDGHSVSLNDRLVKRVKRKQITLNRPKKPPAQ